MSTKCYHCGDPDGPKPVIYDEKVFCCHGCKTVYALFQDNGLDDFYELGSFAGTSPNPIPNKFEFLSNSDIVAKLLEFDEDGIGVIPLHIPSMHCSSCIWVLENLNRLHQAIKASQVDFPKRRVRIRFDRNALSVKDLVLLLTNIGYEPLITADDYTERTTPHDRGPIYKLGVAGFAFGNVMLLSFPEYFEVSGFWIDQYKPFFRWLMFAFSLPVMGYAAQDYFKSAYKGLKNKMLNIDVPIALGIGTLFLRSTVDIVFDLGSGFFDSLTGLVFFLLVGRFFQQKTYAHLSFERDYRSYFPIGVTKVNGDGGETNIEIHQIAKGDRILVRNREIIPIDGILIKGNAHIDYSFVTGESASVPKNPGARIYAGGKQMGGVLLIEALKPVSQSYLTQLWSNSAFSKDKTSAFQSLTDALGKRFTLAVLGIAMIATIFWLFVDPSKALNVFTAVLIIACPCAIALAAPFTLGTLLRIFGRNGFYLKHTQIIERLAQTQFLVFDKTGTLTSNSRSSVFYEGMELSDEEASLLKNTLRASNHPLSRELYGILKAYQIQTLDDFSEITGQGVQGKNGCQTIQAGSASFVKAKKPDDQTAVYVGTEAGFKGRYVFKSRYRPRLASCFDQLKRSYDIIILSGDNPGEKHRLEKHLGFKPPMFFEQTPSDKLKFIADRQDVGKVVMVGDGLNDAGALAQSDVGIAVAENVNVFSPACDAILDADGIMRLPQFLKLSKRAVSIIKLSFIISLCYNLIGLYFAVTGQLEPVIAAILMPLSSISIVVFTTSAMNLLSWKFTLKS